MKLPPVGHPAREWMHIPDVVEMLAPENRGNLPTLDEARRYARSLDTTQGIRRVGIIVLHGDDSIRLWSFGPGGGRELVWTFRG